MSVKRQELENVVLKWQNRESGARIRNREDIPSFAFEAELWAVAG